MVAQMVFCWSHCGQFLREVLSILYLHHQHVVHWRHWPVRQCLELVEAAGGEAFVGARHLWVLFLLSLGRYLRFQGSPVEQLFHHSAFDHCLTRMT